MKVSPLPRPSRDELASLRLHVVVRDFPESLAEIRAAGVSVAEEGDRFVKELDTVDGVLDRLERSLAWRPAPQRSR